MKVILISILMFVGVQLVNAERDSTKDTPLDVAIQCIKEHQLLELFTEGIRPPHRTEENLRMQLLLATNACIINEKSEDWCEDQVGFNVLQGVEEDENPVQEAGGLVECTKKMRDCGKRFVAKIKLLNKPYALPDMSAHITQEIGDD
ncbi:uncharacterized protein LOC126835143 isoform X1 [Adelges cooleyi]|uniref:uncharacterized protein LOC126835143 isoform X1 n=1 Tax=Adelges cooleyi TaxID=133065 RepID=UPI0021805877|nr:uncharacterized protein LOC126835143 isoform X1 [Adelges cooleyi]